MRYARLADQLRYEESVDMGVAASWPHAARAAEQYFRARAGEMIPGWAPPDASDAMPAAAPRPGAVVEISSWEALRAWAPRRKKPVTHG